VASRSVVSAAIARQDTAVVHALPPLTPYDKAALVVVSGLPAPRGVGGVIVRTWDRDLPRPRGALVFADQEGGLVKTFPELPPWRAAAAWTTAEDARAAGRATAVALRGAAVDVDFAPVLDAPDGPLGSRQFARGELGVAFARGLAGAACVKHFPGLGSAPISTDDAPRVHAVVRPQDLRPFRAAIRAGVRCVMVGHAFYRRFGGLRASLEPKTYALLRSLGFHGLAVTDSLSLVHDAPVERWAPQAIRAGADMVLFTSPAHALRAIRALLPLARRGELDAHVASVLAAKARARARAQAPAPAPPRAARRSR
jgi:beta-N-acetylhexosaminidase